MSPMSRRILIVDDEPGLIAVIRDLLTARGFEVDEAYNAADALAAVRERIYDAAILDFNLPDMDGVMLHREIRSMDDELARRTLFVSGRPQTDENLGYYQTFGGGFIAKPFDLQKLIAALNALWE